jgi:hypothetical protein
MALRASRYIRFPELELHEILTRLRPAYSVPSGVGQFRLPGFLDFT